MHTVDPKVEEIRLKAYRRMTVRQRFELVAKLNEFLRKTQLEAIRRDHPSADEYELRMRLGSRWIKPELMRAAFGWDVDQHGY